MSPYAIDRPGHYLETLADRVVAGFVKAHPGKGLRNVEAWKDRDTNTRKFQYYISGDLTSRSTSLSMMFVDI